MSNHSRDSNTISATSCRLKPLKRTINSGELMGNTRELEIEHAGDTYLLRITSNGKLILTK